MIVFINGKVEVAMMLRKWQNVVFFYFLGEKVKKEKEKNGSGQCFCLRIVWVNIQLIRLMVV